MMTWKMMMPPLSAGWRQDGKIELLRSSVCLKSDLQPNSCWFQFFSFSRAQGGLEVYYGHICRGNSTKNSIFVYSQSFSNECNSITKVVDVVYLAKIVLKKSFFPWLNVRIETWKVHQIGFRTLLIHFESFWKTNIIGSSVLTAQHAYLTQDNRFPSCLHFICNRI